MKKFTTFASDVRINALIACSAAVLLTACGGGSPSDSGAAQTSQAAGYVASSIVTDAASNTPAVADSAPAADGSFDLAGYASHPLSADAAPEAAPTFAADGSPKLLASAVAIDVTAAATIPATNINYYVAPTGSDSAAGTKAAPFKTLKRAAQAATKAGTTVWIAPGTYAGGIKTTASGTAGARIYFVSTTKWGAKIVPPASSSTDYAWDNRGNYVSIVGFDVDGSKPGTGKLWLHGLYSGGSYDMIQENHVHHIANAAACTSAGGSAIGVDSYYKGVNDDIVANTVNDIGPKACKFIQGIYVSTSGSVKNNLVYRVGEAAIHLWHDATNVIITNNTVTDSHYGIIVGGGDFYFTSGGNNNTIVANNILYNNGIGISEQGKTGTGNRYTNNLVYKNGTAISLRNGLTATGTVSSDPLFIGYSSTATTPDFHLSASSPAIARGTATNAPATDIDGKARNASVGFDIGAYQH
ncbi:choice-of-anchor Q domain-containing protein [Massilia sp. S19_KUP03_FR1]|uniref:choice-of-anchor Q domain-containing protein n=1 Tax=Massilia sp. S19_KUP03_FR1 TaxID=3025503 RepID=UPI002FCD8247